MNKSSGFTILELMLTVGIIGIVTAIAIPSMRVFMQNDRLTTQINTLVGHLAYARSEAVLRTQPVNLCTSSDGLTCSGAATWHGGWIIYEDTDNNGILNVGVETILKVKQQLDGGNTLSSSIGPTVSYDYRGFASNSVGTFSLCDDRAEANMKSISISPTGRVRQGGGVAC